jgi:hypothetical protein
MSPRAAMREAEMVARAGALLKERDQLIGALKDLSCRLADEADAAHKRIAELEAALTEIRDILPLVNDEYARRVFRIAANAVEPKR